MYVRRAYGKRIWNACYFYTDEPHFLKSGTKSLYLILKKNLKLKKVAILFVCLFVVFVFVKTWPCFHSEANIEKMWSMYFF